MNAIEELVLGGKVRLLQTGRTVQLEEADTLRLRFFEDQPLHRRVEIIKNSNKIILGFFFSTGVDVLTNFSSGTGVPWVCDTGV